ncbi:MAG: hypothetical protein MUO34_05050 [Ignavibacteriaceae bacterium]|nr:hypothetical protein [Ignavibacteriaceae bacterium]
MLKAKRHKAFVLSLEIDELENNVKKIPEDVINEIKDLVTFYNEERMKYDILKNELEEIKRKTIKLPELENNREKLLKAKRYQAYNLSTELKNKKEELEAIPEEELSRIEQCISGYYNNREEQKSKSEFVRKLKDKSKDYNWLKSAKENYNKFLTTPKAVEKITSSLLFIAIIIVIFALISILFDQKIIGITLILLAVLSAAFYLIKYKKSMTVYKQSQEFESISNEFKKRFNIELKDLTQLESLLSEQEKNFNQQEVHQNDLNRLDIQVESSRRSIEEGFKRLKIDYSIESSWIEIISEHKKKRKIILDECQLIREKLAKLEVEESEYELKDSDVKFNKSELEKIETELARLRGLRTQEVEKNNELQDLEDRLKKLKPKIETEFKKIAEEELSDSDWNGRVYKFEKLRIDILNQIKDKRGELRGLGISETDYVKENPGIEFKQSELDQVEIELKILEEKVKEEGTRLSNLKANICSITDSDITTNWNDLIDRLYMKKEEVQKEIAEIEAKIISGKLVYETIEEFQQEEDVKLTDGLNSEEVSMLLFTLTGKYKKLSFEEAGISVSDDYDNFLLKDLSTGAKEQIMLALRIGFLQRLLKQDSAFLILDDAFQHSDYIKRRVLVNTLFDLANNGWQIMYFTMDDHIRDLIKEIGNNMTGDFKEFSFD